MHEVAIMQSALELALEQAAAGQATKIHRIRMRIGVFSGVVPDALRFAFDVLTVGTPAEGAEFQVDVVPARSTCRQCGAGFEVKDLSSFQCPLCEGEPGGFEGGRELEVSEIEVS